MDSSVIAVGIIETFAGNGKSRSTGDGKPATKAGMPLPVGVAIDPQNQSLYYTESGSDRVRRIELATGIISHVAGIGETCYSGDGGPCRWMWPLIRRAICTFAIPGATASAGST